jgi:hypothetical protein
VLDQRPRSISVSRSTAANNDKDKLIEELRNELNRVKTDRKEQQEMWETQTMALMKDLTNRVDKVVELEIFG